MWIIPRGGIIHNHAVLRRAKPDGRQRHLALPNRLAPGEVSGLVLGTTLGFSTVATIALAVTLAFLFGSPDDVAAGAVGDGVRRRDQPGLPG